MELRPADLDDARLIALLALHVERARAETARGSAHALDLDALLVPEIAVWTVWDSETLLAVGAVKRLDATHGEVKSMHTAEAARRRGAGAMILAHLIAEARAAGLERLSLETGSWPYFDAARAFYAAHGFVPCPPFGPYRDDPNSAFLTLALR